MLKQPTHTTLQLFSGPAAATLFIKSLYWKNINMLTFNIIGGTIHNNITFTTSQTQQATRRMHQNMLNVRRSNTVSFGDACLSYNAPQLYNELPENIRNENRVGAIKRKLNLFYKEDPQLVKAII